MCVAVTCVLQVVCTCDSTRICLHLVAYHTNVDKHVFGLRPTAEDSTCGPRCRLLLATVQHVLLSLATKFDVEACFRAVRNGSLMCCDAVGPSVPTSPTTSFMSCLVRRL